MLSAAFELPRLWGIVGNLWGPSYRDDMGTTDRYLDDRKILSELAKKYAVSVPENAADLDVSVDYEGPVVNGRGTARVVISFELVISAEEADELVRAAL